MQDLGYPKACDPHRECPAHAPPGPGPGQLQERGCAFTTSKFPIGRLPSVGAPPLSVACGLWLWCLRWAQGAPLGEGGEGVEFCLAEEVLLGRSVSIPCICLCVCVYVCVCLAHCACVCLISVPSGFLCVLVSACHFLPPPSLSSLPTAPPPLQLSDNPWARCYLIISPSWQQATQPLPFFLPADACTCPGSHEAPVVSPAHALPGFWLLLPPLPSGRRGRQGGGPRAAGDGA